MKFNAHLPVLLSFLIGAAVVGYYVLKVQRVPTESEIVTGAGMLLVGFTQLYQLVVKFLAGLTPEGASKTPPPGPPPAAVSVLALLLLPLLASCATLKPVDDGLKNVVIDCARGVQAAILPAVETALASSNPQATLEADLKALGGPGALCVLNKGVAAVVADLTNALGLSQDPIASKKIQAGQQWLASHPVPAPAARRQRREADQPPQFACARP